MVVTGEVLVTWQMGNGEWSNRFSWNQRESEWAIPSTYSFLPYLWSVPFCHQIPNDFQIFSQPHKIKLWIQFLNLALTKFTFTFNFKNNGHQTWLHYNDPSSLLCPFQKTIHFFFFFSFSIKFLFAVFCFQGSSILFSWRKATCSEEAVVSFPQGYYWSARFLFVCFLNLFCNLSMIPYLCG